MIEGYIQETHYIQNSHDIQKLLHPLEGTYPTVSCEDIPGQGSRICLVHRKS